MMPPRSNPAPPTQQRQKAQQSRLKIDSDSDDDYDHDNDEAYYQEQAYQDGYAAGMSTAHSASRSQHFGPNLEKQMASFETTLARLADRLDKLSLPAAQPTAADNFKNYCFMHGWQNHPGAHCRQMKEDSNYTLAMRNAEKKCTLVATDGTSLKGAN
jgi:hypothetical protein